MEHSVEYAEVRALFESELSVVCLVGGIRVRVPRVLIQAGSEVRRHGDPSHRWRWLYSDSEY
jgi:hypothetical protein